MKIIRNFIAIIVVLTIFIGYYSFCEDQTEVKPKEVSSETSKDEKKSGSCVCCHSKKAYGPKANLGTIPDLP